MNANEREWVRNESGVGALIPKRPLEFTGRDQSEGRLRIAAPTFISFLIRVDSCPFVVELDSPA
jgi:hypothetical protein